MRWVKGIAGVITAVGVILVLALLAVIPTPQFEAASPRHLVGHAAATTQGAACPSLDGADGTTLALARAVGKTAPAGRLAGAGVSQLRPVAPGLAQASQDDASGAIITAEPADGAASQPFGAVAAHGSSERFGLAAALCRGPRTLTWFVGGDASEGRTVVVTLVNPSSAPVTVTIDVWSATGEADWAQVSVVVKPGSSQQVPLSERIVGQTRLAWRVSATGAGIVAFAQTYGTDGLSPTGWEAIPAAPSPAATLIIPLATANVADGKVRLVNPSSTRATYSIEVVSRSGSQALPGATHAVLAPGAVSDISLAGVSDGVRAVRVHASHALVGAALIPGAETSVDSGNADLGAQLGVDTSVKGRDVAWSAAVAPTTAGTLIVPADTEGQVIGYAAQTTRIRLVGTDGAAHTIDIAAHSTGELGLSPGVYTLSSPKPVSVGVALAREAGVAWLPVVAAQDDAAASRVLLWP